MFTIFTKNVGGRSFDMYFQSWENAEKFVQKDIKDCKENGFTITEKNIGFNAEKGFGYCDIYGKTAAGEKVTWSLLNGFFADHLVTE